MKFIIYFGLYLLIIGLLGTYEFLNAPLCDENGNKLEDSTLEKWKKTLKK